MTDFWWVNHNQTALQEIDGQYLWSPKTESNGARSEFYNNMRRAAPGDLVLSYSAQAIRYVGRVAEFAFTAPKPEEFGDTGGYWYHEGWLLPVFWTPLSTPVRPKSVIAALGPHLPKRHSPINPISGAGHQKAYLAAISKGAFDVVVAGAEFNRDALARGGSNSLAFEVVAEILEDAVERRIAADTRLDGTVKESVILARRGQGKFRANVEAIEATCRLTGVANPSLLIASHIKPWRLCGSAEERLDGMNGLLLTPDADWLFDRGFISFEDGGEIMISARVDRADMLRLGFRNLMGGHFAAEQTPSWQPVAFPALRHPYLAYHRSQVFIC